MKIQAVLAGFAASADDARQLLGPWVQISELKYSNFDFNLEEGRNIKI